MKDGKIIYNNLQSLNDIERKAIDIYENGTRKEFRDFFEENFEDEYDSFKAFKTDLFTKAKGYTKIENKVFSDALDEAFKQSSVYDVETYRKSKEIANKYFAHLGRTKESQNMILDYIANDIDIDSDKLLKANAKYFEEKSVNHGLYAFPDDIYTVKGSTNNPLERIDDNINDIIKNKQMEMSLTSSEYMIGPIGVTGKTSPIAYHTNDIRSHLEFSFDGGKRIYQQNNKRGTGTVQDIIDSLEKESTVDLFSRHDELIGKGLDVESLWVKEDFYTQNKDYVHELMQKYNINNLDLIHASENTEKIIPSQIERINVFSKANVEDKKLTPQEAFDKYGPNDDKFYTSQGLDPKKQKEAINKLNSKRKQPEPLPDYSADDARLDKMFTEDKAYIESLEKQRKRPNYKPVKGPKLKKKNNNIIDKIFEFEDKYENNINFNNENIKQEFEKLSKGHGKLYSELLYRPKEYRQELSKYYEALKSDIRPFHEIPKIIGNDIEPIMSVQNIFAQEHGFESYNDMLKYTSEHFDGKSPISIKKISELKNNVKTEISEPKPKETVKQDKNLDKLYQDKIDWINQHHPDLVESNEAKVKLYDYINDKSKKISFDDIIRANASAHVNDTVYHGMANPFYKLSEKETFELINKGDIAVADSSLFNIINNKNIEISVSNKPVYSHIGIKGKADILAYFTSDVGSYVQDNGKRVVKGNSLLNRFIHKREQKGNYHEGFARNFNIESLWVKENFYNKNKKEIIELLKKYNIKKIDIIDKNDKIKQTFNLNDFNDIESNVKIDDSLDNLKKESVKNKKYKPVKGPKPKEKVIEEVTEELPKKQLTKASTEAIENGVKNINFKKIGKIGAVVAAVGLAAYGIGKHNKNKKQEEERKQQTYQQNNQQLLTRLQQPSNQPIDNSYSMQLASDISSYRYGKQMTDFI